MTLYLTGGEAKGTKLHAPSGADVRPAMARMRITLFDVLGDVVPGATVLDLFAGTGALGFEALSRGAAWATFLDRDERSIEALKRNAEKLRWQDRCAIVRTDSLRSRHHMDRIARPPNLVFVDPPYAMYERPATLEKFLGGLVQGGASAPKGVMVIEHPGCDDWVGRLPFEPLDRREFGKTISTMLKWSRGV